MGIETGRSTRPRPPAQELAKLRRYKLLIVDEVGYIPFDQDSANLFFQLVSSRYEHASLVLTSNLAFSRWGEVFSDATVASAMIDRIVHHSEVLNLTGSSYRLRNKTRNQLQAQYNSNPWPCFQSTKLALFSVGVNTGSAQCSPPTMPLGNYRPPGWSKNSCGPCSLADPSPMRPPRKTDSRPWQYNPHSGKPAGSDAQSADGGKRSKS